jgi:hypothetical protein
MGGVVTGPDAPTIVENVVWWGVEAARVAYPG